MFKFVHGWAALRDACDLYPVFLPSFVLSCLLENVSLLSAVGIVDCRRILLQPKF